MQRSPSNDIVLNSPQTAGCEYIDQDSNGELTLHYKQISQGTVPIMTSQTTNGATTINLLGNTNINGEFTTSGIARLTHGLSVSGGNTGITGNLTVTGTSNIKNVAFQNTPTVSGNAKVTSTLNFENSGQQSGGTINLGTNGKIGSNSGNTAYIENGV